MMQVSVRVGSHKSVKRVGVDLAMGARTGSASLMVGGSPSHGLGFRCKTGVGYSRRAVIWYGGGIDLVDRITNAIPDHADSA